MNFYGVRELSNNTKNVLSSVSENGTAVITDNGKPAALMIGISEKDFESVLDMVRQMKLKRTVEELQAQSQANFPNGLSEEEIEAEIQAARKGR